MPEAMPSLTVDDIRALASHQSFERGYDYYHGGAVFNARLVGSERRGQRHTRLPALKDELDKASL